MWLPRMIARRQTVTDFPGDAGHTRAVIVGVCNGNVDFIVVTIAEMKELRDSPLQLASFNNSVNTKVSRREP